MAWLEAWREAKSKREISEEAARRSILSMAKISAWRRRHRNQNGDAGGGKRRNRRQGSNRVGEERKYLWKMKTAYGMKGWHGVSSNSESA